jgi:hypothetical protein
MLPHRFRSLVAGAPCGPGRLATGSLVTLAASSSLLDVLGRDLRVKAEPRYAALGCAVASRGWTRRSRHEGWQPRGGRGGAGDGIEESAQVSGRIAGPLAGR